MVYEAKVIPKAGRQQGRGALQAAYLPGPVREWVPTHALLPAAWGMEHPFRPGYLTAPQVIARVHAHMLPAAKGGVAATSSLLHFPTWG